MKTAIKIPKSTDFLTIPLLVSNVFSFKMIYVDTNTPYMFVLRIWEAVLYFIDFWLCGVGLMRHLFYALLEGADMQEISNTLFPTMYLTLIGIKIVAIGYNRQKLNVMLIRMDRILPKTAKDMADFKYDEWIARTYRVSFIASVVTLVMAIFLSFGKTLENMVIDHSYKIWNLQLPYLIDYFFDYKQPVIYEILFLSHFAEACFCLLMNSATHFMLLGLIQQMNMHYEYLSEHLITKGLMKTKMTRNEIKKIVDRHIEINR